MYRTAVLNAGIFLKMQNAKSKNNSETKISVNEIVLKFQKHFLSLCYICEINVILVVFLISFPDHLQ